MVASATKKEWIITTIMRITMIVVTGLLGIIGRRSDDDVASYIMHEMSYYYNQWV
jgi:hypothetical protein